MRGRDAGTACGAWCASRRVPLRSCLLADQPNQHGATGPGEHVAGSTAQPALETANWVGRGLSVRWQRQLLGHVRAGALTAAAVGAARCEHPALAHECSTRTSLLRS